MNPDFRYESLKREFSIILFFYNLMIECFKRIEEISPKEALEQRNKETWVSFEASLASYIHNPLHSRV